ncbi:MAG TPA: S41 family peptidase [Tissierellaceae bacterium]|nr:S41 family peptidase [Tissierellaceae bacterium]
MKKNKVKYIPIFLLIILVFSFVFNYIFPSNKDLCDIESSFHNILYDYKDFNDELPVITSATYSTNQNHTISITKDEVFEDIDYLFSLLKYGYSAYDFFGGDEVFLQAKKDILSSIEDLNKDVIYKDKILEIILSNLDFIQDSHFVIEDYRLCTYTKYFSTREYTFHEDSEGFYTYLNNDKLYLANIDNDEVSCYMKESLDENGDLVYKLGVLSDTSDISVSLELLFQSNEELIKKNISLFEYIPVYEEQEKSYIYYEMDNTSVLKLNSFCPMTPDDNSIEEFLKDSKNLRGKDKFIIDLRGNIGGSMINAEEWVKGFTGKKLQKDIVEAGLYTNTSIALSKKKFQAKENEPEDVKNICLDEIENYETKDYFPGWSPVKYTSSKPIKNDTNIVILADKNTASAAEFFIHYLRKLENITVIGTLTNGCVLTGNCNMAILPNSNIRIKISHKIYMNRELSNIDGFGLVPDFWVKPDQSLDRAIKYLNNKK